MMLPRRSLPVMLGLIGGALLGTDSDAVTNAIAQPNAITDAHTVTHANEFPNRPVR